MIKTFHVRTNFQLANVFTKPLGVPTFMNLVSRLGLLNVFSASIIYPRHFQDTTVVSTSEAALILRGTVKKKGMKIVENKAMLKKPKVKKKKNNNKVKKAQNDTVKAKKRLTSFSETPAFWMKVLKKLLAV